MEAITLVVASVRVSGLKFPVMGLESVKLLLENNTDSHWISLGSISQRVRTSPKGLQNVWLVLS